MRKKVLIVDDESDARLLLRQYIEPYENFDVIGECDNGLDAVTAINQMEPDLVFLDIKMPGLSGLQVVQQMIHVPRIVFTTAYDQYALRAFDSNAVDYLLKPYTAERFEKTVNKITALSDFSNVQRMADEASGNKYFSRILVESGNKFINLAVKDIIYLEAEKDYSRIHTEQKTYLSNYGIGELEQRMDPSLFLRIHRSYIVNIDHITELHKDGSTAQLTMKNNSHLNVSRTYMEELKKLLY